MLKNMILRRCISRSTVFRSCYDYNSAGNFRSLSSACGRESATKPSVSRPRMMLPPVQGGAGEIVGCSHGWAAVFNKCNNDLFLSDPLSHRNIKLPPIHTLPDPDFNLDLDGHASVTKVILSSSPEDDDCRAMMTFGPANRLAFCLPGRSSEWTPIGKHFFDYDCKCPLERVARVHEDLVYCSRRKYFTSITAGQLDLRTFHLNYFDDGCDTMERHDWDIQNPNSPKFVGMENVFVESPRENRWLDENEEVLENECIQIPHLVYAKESDQLFLVMQFVRLLSGDGRWPLGSVPRCEVKGLDGVFGGKTYGFVVLEMNDEDAKDSNQRENSYDRLVSVVEDLNGMSMFIGINQSFAISACDEIFKPNCIYFADAKRFPRVCCPDDTGVFDYATKAISSLDAPTEARPFWFC